MWPERVKPKRVDYIYLVVVDHEGRRLETMLSNTAEVVGTDHIMMIKAIIEADDDKLTQLKLFLGGY